jgi:hypothetical protein
MKDDGLRKDGSNLHDLGSWRGSENDPLDRELDAALAEYAAGEPRTGLEHRVLANLKAAKERAAARVWWRWPALAVLATIILVAVSMDWRLRIPVRKITMHPAATTPSREQAPTQVANNSDSGPIRSQKAASAGRLQPRLISRSATVIASASAPKLEQFPSPQPLSEQEAILAGYVTKYPERAALIAQARTEALQRDIAEQAEEAARSGNRDSQQHSN